MNDARTDRNRNIICHCSGTTKETIKMLVDDKVTNLDGISRKTGACSGCRACEMSILDLINEYRYCGDG